jgi:dienelactone hydrolase
MSANNKKSNNNVLAPSPKSTEHRPRRLRIRLILIGVLIPTVLVLLLMPFGLGFGAMWATTRAGCINDGRTPAAFGLSYQDINLPARWGGTYRGFFMPGTLNATIIIPPTGPGGRGTTLDVGALLAAHGYGVLTFESRRCVGKSISLGYREVEDVEDALTYLRLNPDHLAVKPDHVGLYGFSTAGATVTMAAARDPAFAAMVAVGNYSNLSDMATTTDPHDILSALVGLGIRLGYWLSTGEDAANLNPLGAIPQVAPRPVLLIYGSLEPSLPGARQQLAALLAADPGEAASLWIVPGADHGTYFDAVGKDEFARHLLPFFDCALLKQSCPNR